jgi:hypothetical protein
VCCPEVGARISRRNKNTRKFRFIIAGLLGNNAISYPCPDPANPSQWDDSAGTELRVAGILSLKQSLQRPSWTFKGAGSPWQIKEAQKKGWGKPYSRISAIRSSRALRRASGLGSPASKYW